MRGSWGRRGRRARRSGRWRGRESTACRAARQGGSSLFTQYELIEEHEQKKTWASKLVLRWSAEPIPPSCPHDPNSLIPRLNLHLAQIGPRHSSLHLNDLSLRLWGAGGGSKARLGLRGAPHRPRNSQTKSLTTRHKLGLSKNCLHTQTGLVLGPGIGGAEFRRRAVAAADASTRGN